MAQRKNVKTVADELDESAGVTSADIDYAEFLEDIGADVTQVMVWRIPRNGEAEWVDTTTVENVKDFHMLYDNYGPGKYSIRFKGANRFKGSKTVILAERKPNQAAVAAKPDGEAEIIRARMHEMTMAMIAAQKPMDLGAMMTGIAALLKPPDPAAMLTAVVAATQMMRGEATEKTDVLSQIRDVMAVVNEVRPPSSNEDNVYTVVKDVGERVVDALAGRAGGNGVAVRPAVPPGAVPITAKPAATPGPPAERSQEENMRAWIKAQLDSFKAKAKQEKPVEFFVDYLFINEDEPGCKALLFAVEHGATFENLLEFDPEIAQNQALKAWFQALYDGVRKELSEAMDSARASGDAGNASSDAATGAPGQPALDDKGAG